MFTGEQITMLEELAQESNELGKSYINNDTYSLEQTASNFVDYLKIPGVFGDVDEDEISQLKKNIEKNGCIFFVKLYYIYDDTFLLQKGSQPRVVSI